MIKLAGIKNKQIKRPRGLHKRRIWSSQTPVSWSHYEYVQQKVAFLGYSVCLLTSLYAEWWRHV